MLHFCRELNSLQNRSKINCINLKKIIVSCEIYPI